MCLYVDVWPTKKDLKKTAEKENDESEDNEIKNNITCINGNPQKKKKEKICVSSVDWLSHTFSAIICQSVVAALVASERFIP